MPNQKLPPAIVTRFCQEYLKDLNATQAYLRIRPKTKPNSAGTLGARLLGKVETQETIARLRQEQHNRLRIEADTVLQELAICGFSDVQHYIQDDLGRFAIAPGIDHLASRAVSSVKQRSTTRGEGKDAQTEHVLEYRLWPKPEALKLLSQHLGLISKGEEDAGGIGGVTLTVRFVAE